MIKVLGLDLKGVGTFNEASVDFNEGLLYIRGMNKDSDPAAPTSNGAGKTLLMSAFPNVAYFAHPMALRKKDRKDLLRKGSSIVLPISRHEADYEIHQTSGKYQIFKDGVDEKVRTVALAEKYIRDIFPICEDDYYSRIYITTQQPYAIQYASDADRLQKFVNIFNLDQHEQVKLHFAAQLRTIKDSESRVKILGEQVERTRRKIKEIETSVTKEEYEEARESMETMQASCDAMREKRQALNVKLVTLNKLLLVEQELDKLRAEYSFKKPPEAMLEELKSIRKAVRLWADYDSASARTKKQVKQLTQQFAQYTKPTATVEGLEVQLVKTKAALRAATKIADALADAKADYEEFTSEFDRLYKQVPKGWRPLTDEQKADYKTAQLTIRLKKLAHSDCSDGKCPTCLNPVDTKTVRLLVKKAEAKILECEEGEAIAEIMERLNVLKDSIANTGFMQIDLDAAEADCIKYRKESKKLDVDIANAEKYYRLSKELKTLERTQIAEPNVERPELTEDELEDGMEMCNTILRQISAKAQLVDSSVNLRTASDVETAIEAANVKLSTYDKWETKLQIKLANLSDIISGYETYLSHKTILRVELRTQLKEIEAIKPLLKDKMLVETLVKAYGSKGLRCIAAETICSLYEQRLNEYATLTFAEPLIFKVTAYEGGISIMATGKGEEYDIRKLSGAESNSFRLASSAALETLTPSSRKCNLKIFDEPTEHMCPVSRQLIRERFIPLIRELTPTVVIITNNEEDVDQDSAQWTVVKENGVSIVVKDR